MVSIQSIQVPLPAYYITTSPYHIILQNVYYEYKLIIQLLKSSDKLGVQIGYSSLLFKIKTKYFDL